jgi:hypothetical protein
MPATKQSAKPFNVQVKEDEDPPPSGLHLYVSGPMRGLPQYNFPAFDEAEQRLAMEGHTVVSPAALDREVGFDPDTTFTVEDFYAAMRRDIGVLLGHAEQAPGQFGIVLLPGWQGSEGVRIERTVNAAVGGRTFTYNPSILGCLVEVAS